MHNRIYERGNVLFLILIAVALFAALSYVVSSSNRSGSANTSKETMELALGYLRNTVTSYRTALTRMSVAGVDPNRFSFERPGFNYTNSNCTAADCKLFDPANKLGAIFAPFARVYPGYSVPFELYGNEASESIMVTWWAGQGTELMDFVYRASVTESFCNYINKKLGIDTPFSVMHPNAIAMMPVNGPIDNASPARWVDSFADAHASHLKGHIEGCYRQTGVDIPFYVAVIFPH